MKRLLLFVSLLCTSLISFGQEIPIADGTVTGCSGFLLDTGIAFDDYSNNEDFTMTLCAEMPETITNLYFNTFNIGAGDSMTIYDGATTDADLIGVYVFDELQGVDITSSVDGCLTVVWHSDDADTGNFSAEISCGLPCERPFVGIDLPLDAPFRICVDEEFSLDASSTVFADGTALGTFTWDFADDSTNSTDWPIVSHSYSEPGAYIVQLYVTDDNECNSGNTIDLRIEVSTTPDFGDTSADVMACLGEEVVLNGVVEPVEWGGTPSSNFGGALFIPDVQGQCFGSEIPVSGFLGSQTVQELTDIQNLFINFEHSFMGDLTITFICPNGQSLLVHSNQGGGTFLGEPVDNDGTPEVEGVGYDYYWSSEATNGTWGDESINFQTLPSDTYASEADWTELTGCPLNGIWEVEICDNLGSDNGYIFDWSIQFDPSLYPGDLTFTPSIGADCDSTFWTSAHTNVVPDDNCNDLTTNFTEPGEYTFTYNALDNHGCSYSEDVTVNVTEVMTSVEDFTICPEQVLNMNSSVSFSNATITNMTYEWTPSDFLSTDDVVSPNAVDVETTTTYTFLAYPTANPECGSVSEVTVTPIEGPSALIEGDDWCPDSETTLIAFDGGTVDSLNWVFVDSLQYISNESVITVDQGGTYLLTSFGCGIFATDTFFVEEKPCEISIPNVFSPNGDNEDLNNAFYIDGIESESNAHLLVYNRWGTLVFEDTNYKGKWSPDEDEVTDGVYFYILKRQNGDDRHGSVTILR